MENGELSGDSPARPPPLIEVALYYVVHEKRTFKITFPCHFLELYNCQSFIIFKKFSIAKLSQIEKCSKG